MLSPRECQRTELDEKEKEYHDRKQTLGLSSQGSRRESHCIMGIIQIQCGGKIRRKSQMIMLSVPPCLCSDFGRKDRQRLTKKAVTQLAHRKPQ